MVNYALKPETLRTLGPEAAEYYNVGAFRIRISFFSAGGGGGGGPYDIPPSPVLIMKARVLCNIEGLELLLQVIRVLKSSLLHSYCKVS